MVIVNGVPIVNTFQNGIEVLRELYKMDRIELVLVLFICTLAHHIFLDLLSENGGCKGFVVVSQSIRIPWAGGEYINIVHYIPYIHWVGNLGFGILCYLIGCLLILVGPGMPIISVDVPLQIQVHSFEGLDGLWPINLLPDALVSGGVIYLLYWRQLNLCILVFGEVCHGVPARVIPESVF